MNVLLVAPSHDSRPLLNVGSILGRSHHVITIDGGSDPLARMRAVYREIERQMTGDSVVVATMPCFGARVAHEKLGAALVTVVPRPEAIAWGALAATLPLRLREQWRRRVDHAAERRVVEEVDSLRRELGLATPIADPLSDWVCRATHLIYPFPAWFAARTTFRPPKCADVTGLIVCDDLPGESLPASLRSFLEAGAGPIVFKLRGDFADAAPAICRHLGKRGVVLGASTPPNYDQVCAAPDAPPELIARRACALVHHGELPMTVAALAAGVPQVIVPTDAFTREIAGRLKTLGVAGVARGLKLAAIEKVLSGKEMARRGAQIARRVAAEDGAGHAARIIEQSIPGSAPN